MGEVIDWGGYLLLMLKGAFVTAQLTVMGCAVALIVAFTIGLARLSPYAGIRAAALAYVVLFRGTSVLVQLFWAFYVLPQFGIRIPAMLAGGVVLGLNIGAYSAEVVRGAIQSVDREQIEACIALNLTRWQRMRHVILPQALLVMIPVFGNNAIELLKATAVVSLITITDLTFQTQIIRSSTGQTAIPFIVALILYYTMSLAMTFSIYTFEGRLRMRFGMK